MKSRPTWPSPRTQQPLRSELALGITCGDPAGIGPEVVRQALKKGLWPRRIVFHLFGDSQTLKIISRGLDTRLDLHSVMRTNRPFTPGRPSPRSAQCALQSLDQAVRALHEGRLHGLVTAPVSKQYIEALGDSFPGHTEYLAKAFHKKNVVMLFAAPGLRTALLTRHVALRTVAGAVTKRKILNTLKILHEGLCLDFGLPRPHIAVCGLNPHAGEGGIMGDEEITRIGPAIQEAREKGIEVSGPFSADTLFIPENRRRFDAILAAYHDQGLIPMKTLYFHRVVNVTLGLPFVRTSPSHGTAFDRAGKGRADDRSMKAALRLAVTLTQRRIRPRANPS